MFNRTFGILCLISNFFALLIVFITRFSPRSWVRWGYSMESPDWAVIIGPKSCDYINTVSMLQLGIIFLMFVLIYRCTNWSQSSQENIK